VAWGTIALHPAWLARPLLLSPGMRSWHDSAAPCFGATPPAVRLYTSDAVGSGLPPLDHLARGAGPPGVSSWERFPGPPFILRWPGWPRSWG